ncbi:hypothetical protein K1719_021011 [Acacia pycnantha]|nr:hypothetical protein K1719_021011 [Acacia pycnantha]
MLEGKIPTTIGNMKNLLSIDLSENKFSGTIPLQIFELPSLAILLNLSYNSLNGSLPIEVGKLKNLGTLDISKNNLSGEIPWTIGECTSMEFLNLKGNSFNGPMLPSLTLMRGLTHLDISRNNLSGSILMGLQNISLKYLNVSFNMLDGEVPTEGVFSNSSAISVIGNINLCGGFSSNNLIGSGSYGSVYKGRLESKDKLVAIKGEEFKALIFEYMSNGSLEKWLHPNQESEYGSTLDIFQRLNVIYDVASAVHYLHYENEQPIVHCDLKPSNILLDDDMVAHVGTIGYTPPEYGISFEVSTQDDVYSFGILILEMLTGRRPTNLMFGDGHNLHSYAKVSFPNNLLEIMDTTLVPHQIQKTTIAGGEIRMEEVAIMHPNHEKTLISLFELGLACSVEPPKERIYEHDGCTKGAKSN